MIDKGLLALNKIEELEELIKKKKGTGGSSSGEYIEKENLHKIEFINTQSFGAVSYCTDVSDFGVGSVAFFIEGKLVSSVATDYKIKIYIKEYLAKEFDITNQNLETDCYFVVPTCIYSQKSMVKIDILPSVTEGININATDFCIYTKQANITYPSICSGNNTGSGNQIVKMSVKNGIDNTDTFSQEYAFGTVQDGTIFVGSCARENFSAENSKTEVLTETFASELDFCTSYNLVPPTDTTPIKYRNQICIMQSKNYRPACYKNITGNSAYYSTQGAGKDLCIIPATDGACYSMGFSYYATGTYFHLYRTNKTNNYSTGHMVSAIYQGLESTIMPNPRNLAQAVLPVHLFFLRDGGVLYSALYSSTGSPAIVENISESMEKLKSCVYEDDEGRRIKLYYLKNNYIKCYTLEYQEDTGKYAGVETKNIIYGVSSFVPLIDNDVVIAYGDKVFYSKEGDKLCINT